MPKTKVLLYQEDDGAVPLLEWLDSLPSKAVAKCRVRIERLAELGHELRRPEADFLRDGVYELRVGLQGQNYRILYFFYEKAVVVLSHGVIKEREVPPREIDKALERKRKLEADPKRHVYKET